MIPQLNNISPVQSLYLNFIDHLSKHGFKGELCPDYANRTVLATDNSIYQILPQGVLYPKGINDVILLCHTADLKQFHEIVLSPRGGGTGTNGQSLTDGLIVDVSKHMNEILEINVQERWVRVQSGVVKDQLNAAIKPHGLFFAPDLSTSNRATIGGMINTDASGQGSCVYGKTRDHVLELQTVLLDGSVVQSKALSDDEFTAISQHQDKTGLIHRLIDSIDKEHHEKINEVFPPLNRCLTGYDLAHIRDETNRFNLNNILCGSEGTLGFISEAKLNLLPIPKHSALVVVKYGDFNASLRDATELMKANPTSVETIDSTVLNLAMNDFIWHQVKEFFDDETPVPVQGINFVEYVGDTIEDLQKQIDALTKNIEQSIKGGRTQRIGYAIAMGSESVNKIWAMRKRAVGLLGNAKGEARPVAFVEDTAVPPENLADYIIEFREILDSYDLKYGMFGHVDAGVLHVRPALDMKKTEHEEMAWEISDKVAELTQKYGGLLWGEHGKGVRSSYSPKFFGELYPQLQRIKAAFDPRNQCNPGKIATPDNHVELLAIDEVPTRGQRNKTIPVQIWNQFNEAVHCNGNGVCFNWNTSDPMCPSWKGTRKRVNSPKGRASLINEWLRLLSVKKTDTKVLLDSDSGSLSALSSLPKQLKNSFKKKHGEYDFSHEVYESMSACLACKACAGQCPIKVDVPEFRSKFLALYHTRYARPIKDYLVASLEFVLPVFAPIHWAYNTVMGLKPTRWFFEKYIGFVDSPLYTGLSLKRARVEVAVANNLKVLSDEKKAKTVVIVQDAFTRFFDTQVVIDLVNYLKSLGFDAQLAPYNPNGKPLHVHGFLKPFKKAAQKNADELMAIHNAGIPLVGIDPSMTLTYRGEYQKHLNVEDIPPVLLIQEWLEQHLELIQHHTKEKPNDSNGYPARSFKLMTHCTEQTNAAQSSKQWQKVFDAAGHSLEVLSLGCCGMAGTYGHEKRNVETSKHLYELSWKSPVQKHFESGELVATGYSCRSQIKREDQKHVPHPIQALLKANS